MLHLCFDVLLFKSRFAQEKEEEEEGEEEEEVLSHSQSPFERKPRPSHIIVDFSVSQHQPRSQGPCMFSSFSRWLHLLSRFRIPTASPSVSLLVPANHGPYNNIIPAPIVPILAQHKRLRHSSLTLRIPTSTQLLQLRVS